MGGTGVFGVVDDGAAEREDPAVGQLAVDGGGAEVGVQGSDEVAGAGVGEVDVT